ncbi:MAG: hypothetical protein QOE70_4619 [Chthoniobacter sp.]|jgi:MYXO-CTERM domain-containing protein|nr:hypothetical protein [Chthoniobacter sp.]
MKSILLGCAVACLCLNLHARAASFADAVIEYTSGTGVGSFTNPASALGAPNPVNGAGVFSPFNPSFETSQLTRIGNGGHLTLRLTNYVLIDRTGIPELGIWENVFLVNSGTTANPRAGNPAGAFGGDSAVVEVSEDGIAWYALNNANPILFTLPGNYFLNSGLLAKTAPANPEYADFGKPFTGSLSSFDGADSAGILTALDGSAGGTWLDLDTTPLAQVGYVRFSGVASGSTLEVDAVAINSSLAGAQLPEPSTWTFLLLGLGLFAFRRRRMQGLLAVAWLALLPCNSARCSTVSSFDDIQFWIGTGTNRAGLLIDWYDGKNAPGSTFGETLAWGFRWQTGEDPTGQDMLLAIDAVDQRLHLAFGNHPTLGSYLFGVGYDLDGDGGTFVFDANPVNEQGSASDFDDHIAYGFNTIGYWSYLTGTPDGPARPDLATGWNYAAVGAPGRNLANGSWDAWVFSNYATNPDFDPLPPSIPLAAIVPEPATSLLVLSGLLVSCLRQRRS